MSYINVLLISCVATFCRNGSVSTSYGTRVLKTGNNISPRLLDPSEFVDRTLAKLAVTDIALSKRPPMNSGNVSRRQLMIL